MLWAIGLCLMAVMHGVVLAWGVLLYDGDSDGDGAAAHKKAIVSSFLVSLVQTLMVHDVAVATVATVILMNVAGGPGARGPAQSRTPSFSTRASAAASVEATAARSEACQSGKRPWRLSFFARRGKRASPEQRTGTPVCA